MADNLTDLIKYICLGNESHSEILVETLKSEKCCYTYKKGNDTQEFRGKLQSVAIGEKYSLEDGTFIELVGLTKNLTLKGGRVYSHGNNELGILLENLLAVE